MTVFSVGVYLTKINVRYQRNDTLQDNFSKSSTLFPVWLWSDNWHVFILLALEIDRKVQVIMNL